METEIRMVSAASEVFSYKKKNPNAIHEDVFQHIADYISHRENVKDDKIKFAMIAAAGRAFDMANKNPDASEKALLKDFMDEIPELLNNIEE